MITKKVIEHYIPKLHLFITNVVKRKKNTNECYCKYIYL